MWVNFESMKRLISPLNVILPSIRRDYSNTYFYKLSFIAGWPSEDGRYLGTKFGTVKILNKNIRFVSFSNFTRIKHHLKNRTGRNLNHLRTSQFQDTSNDVSKSKIIARQFRDHYRGRATSPLRAEASDKRVALLYYKRVSRGCIYATCTGIESKLFITSSPARHFITPFNSCIVQMRNKNNERATRTAILSAPSRKRDG